MDVLFGMENSRILADIQSIKERVSNIFAEVVSVENSMVAHQARWISALEDAERTLIGMNEASIVLSALTHNAIARKENHKITYTTCLETPLTPLHSLMANEKIAGFPPTVGAFFRLTESDLVRIIKTLGFTAPCHDMTELRTILKVLIGLRYFSVDGPADLTRVTTFNTFLETPKR